MDRTIRPAVMTLVLFFLAAQAGGATEVASTDPDRYPVIVSTGNLRGIFEPCRCPTNPYGGVARRVTWVAQYRKAHPHAVFVDSGDVFDAGTSKSWGSLLTWGYRLCACDAVAVGSRDVMYSRQIGGAQFKALGIPWVCGNMEQGREEFGVERYRILERGGKRIAVTALLSPQLLNADVLKNEKPPISLKNPQDALRSLVAELKPKADLLCVLAHMPYPAAEQLFQRFPEVDVVILGNDTRLAKKEDAFPGARALVETGTSGQYMTISALLPRRMRPVVRPPRRPAAFSFPLPLRAGRGWGRPFAAETYLPPPCPSP